MSSQQGQARGRARATARGKPPQQPQGRGAEPRRPGPPAGGPSGAQAAAPKPQVSFHCISDCCNQLLSIS